MTIDFSGIEAVPNVHFKGGEGQVLIKTGVNDGKVKVMQLTIPAGSGIGMHRHSGNSEEVLVLQGTGHFLVDDGSGLRREDVAAGSVHYCPDGVAHSFTNDGEGPALFFAVVG